MTKQIITIELETEIDSSSLLDIMHSIGELIVEEIGTYGEDAVYVEGETSVETK